MTPEERAKLIIRKGGWHHPTGVDCDRLEERIAAAIREAVTAEREACAAIADEWASEAQRELGHGGPAAVIRERTL